MSEAALLKQKIEETEHAIGLVETEIGKLEGRIQQLELDIGEGRDDERRQNRLDAATEEKRQLREEKMQLREEKRQLREERARKDIAPGHAAGTTSVFPLHVWTCLQQSCRKAKHGK